MRGPGALTARWGLRDISLRLALSSLVNQFKQALLTLGLRTRRRGDQRDGIGRDFWWRPSIEFSDLVSPEVAGEVVGELLEPRVVRAPFLGLIKGEVEPLELDVASRSRDPSQDGGATRSGRVDDRRARHHQL